jgi:hypothetical protein
VGSEPWIKEGQLSESTQHRGVDHGAAAHCSISTALLTNLSFQGSNEKRRTQREAGGSYKLATRVKLLEEACDFKPRTTEITQPKLLS